MGRWGRFPDLESALAYVRIAVLNGARSALRKRKSDSRRIPEADEATEPADVLAIDRLERDRVRKAINRLPARQREVVILRYLGGLNSGEVAQVLRISPGAVRSSLSKALASLGTDLGSS